MSRLTINQVVEAQRLKLSDPSLTWTELGDRFGVHRSTVQRAVETNGMQDKVKHDGLSQTPDENEVAVIFRDYSHLDTLRLYSIGDIHKGASTHQTERWREWLGYIEKEEDTSLILAGDLHNAALVGSKSDPYEERLTVGQSKRELVKELAQLAGQDRIDVAIPGNHDWRVTAAVGDCVVQDICDFLDIPYARSAVMLVYLVGDQQYRVFLRHGTGNSPSFTAMMKGGDVILADLYLTAHTHNMQHAIKDIFDLVDGKIVRRHRHFVTSGSFLGYERYCAERGYAPARIGAPRIYLDGRVHDIKVSM